MHEFALNDAMHYQQYAGPLAEALPRMRAERAAPLSVRDVLERRISVQYLHDAVVRSWCEHPFATIDGVAYHSDGWFKLAHAPRALLTMTSHTALSQDALVLDEQTYASLEGVECSVADRPYVGRPMSERQALKDKGLRYLLGEEEIISASFKLARDWYHRTDLFGLRLDSPPTGSPLLRHVVIDTLWAGSDLVCDGSLGTGYLVGRTRAPLDPAVRLALAEKTSFEHDGTLYLPVTADTGVSLQEILAEHGIPVVPPAGHRHPDDIDPDKW